MGWATGCSLLYSDPSKLGGRRLLLGNYGEMLLRGGKVMARSWEEMLSNPIENEVLRQKESEQVVCGDCLYPKSICGGCQS